MEGLRVREGSERPPLFNSTIETGIRAVIVLEALYPRACSLETMTCFDHVVVHSHDLDGPPSLHPDLKPRTGELVVRRDLVRESLKLMVRMNLVEESHTGEGIRFVASDDVPRFLKSMRAAYSVALKDRARWIAERFGEMTEQEIGQVVTGLLGRWTLELGQAREFPGDVR